MDMNFCISGPSPPVGGRETIIECLLKERDKDGCTQFTAPDVLLYPSDFLSLASHLLIKPLKETEFGLR